LRLTILGSGTSFGIPQIGCHCEVCTSKDPKDKRTRVSAIVESDAGKRILIDTPPELRLQLIGAGVDEVDAVLYTHDHADHVQGIDDLRAISVKVGRLPVYGPPETMRRIRLRFDYIFDNPVPSMPSMPRPELAIVPLEPDEEVQIAGLPVRALLLEHGPTKVYGYRIGRMAYVTDAKTVPESAITALRGVEVLVLNALFDRPHPSHLSIPEALDVARAVGARHTFFTHLTHRTSHASLVARLPAGVEPAYDGLFIEF
jgi:phosphoribosyl 1,2-cyclic phosphate phosphodiesterase